MRLSCWPLGLLVTMALGAQACSADSDRAKEDLGPSGGVSATGGSPAAGAGNAEPGGGQAASAAGAPSGEGGRAGSACSPRLVLEADAIGAAVDEFTGSAAEIQQGVALACANLTADILGGPEDAGVAEPSPQLCLEAAELLQSVTATWVVEGGWCGTDTDALFECEATCSSGVCDQSSVEDRCSTKDIAAVCDSCHQGGVCLGSTESPAQCRGTCSGICKGTCAGDCVMKPGTTADDCQGFCSSECTGSCTGSCELSSDMDCGEPVPCLGGCRTVPDQALCQAAVHPPSCDISDSCRAACTSLAALRSVCSPPKVVVLDASSAQVVATLEAHLPAILRAAAGEGRLALDAVTTENLASFATTMADAIAADPVCLAESDPQSVDRLRSVAETTADLAAVVDSAQRVLDAVPPAP